jgi:hypothetical protein
MHGLIDPPTPFSSTERWTAFLANLKRNWPQDDPSVQDLMQQGEKELARRQKATKPWWGGGQTQEPNHRKAAAD